ncbi:MAG: hypothetical protein AAF993_12210 [Pseudomonadota bacterium]
MRIVDQTKTLVALSFGLASASLAAEAEYPDRAQMTMGNGEANWIIVDDVQRDGGTLTFSEVKIDGNGWLVIHPFENGAPNGDKYVASTYLTDGTNQNVDIKVHKGLTEGEMFIVMLHRDGNENQVLDFVFVDEVNVMDKAVFEGNRMIGHAIPAP